MPFLSGNFDKRFEMKGKLNMVFLIGKISDILFLVKPPPPKFSDLSDDEAFEVHWHSFCDQLMKFVGFCDVRYRTDADQTWTEVTLILMEYESVLMSELMSWKYWNFLKH